MYEAFFSLGNRPFLGAPCIDRYFPAGAIEHARQALVRCIERGQGPGLLIGPSGTGKSLVCQLLADQFRSMFRVVVLANTRLSSRRALLQSILYELGLSYREQDEGELRLSLAGHLEPSDECPHGLLLIVDEADGLPLRLFDELRSLTNLSRGGQPRVRLLLAGGAALEERFTHPKLESFNQRVAARCYLQPLNREETRHYVRSQVGAVGGNGDGLFPDAATEAVYRATDGIPRLINQVCDAALLLAAQSHQHVVGAHLIEQAWAELQQLPAPWQTAAPASTTRETTSVIEFGQLEGGEETPPSKPHVQAHVQAQVRAHVRAHVQGHVEAQVESPDAPTVESPWTQSLDMPLGGVFVDSWLPEASSITAESNCGAELARHAETVRPVEAAHHAEAPRPVEAARHVEPVPHDAAASSSEMAATTIKDPFGDGFSEEEVVSDRYAKMEVDAIRARIRVSSPQGREIAWSLQNLGRAVADAEPSIVVRRVLPPHSVESSEDASPVNLVLHEPSDVTPEARPHIRLLPDDDRDLLVAEDDGGRVAAAPTEEGRVVRREYRQLFARLRRR